MMPCAAPTQQKQNPSGSKAAHLHETYCCRISYLEHLS
jgi:hypothetical protein